MYSTALEKQHFVGGVSDTLDGLAMIDTTTHNLTAKRSCQFYDDTIIALASRLLKKGQVTVGFLIQPLLHYHENKTSNVP